MQIWFLSNGSYSLKNCHNPFGKAIQPHHPPLRQNAGWTPKILTWVFPYFYSTTCPSLDTLRWKVTNKINNFIINFVATKIGCKIWATLVHDDSFKSVLPLFTWSLIFWYKLTHYGFSKSVPLLFPLSRIFWDVILHDVSFRFVPLLFTSYQIFNDNFYIIWYIINNIVHDGSYKSVPLCFTISIIFWDEIVHNRSFQICSATFHIV